MPLTVQTVHLFSVSIMQRLNRNMTMVQQYNFQRNLVT